MIVRLSQLWQYAFYQSFRGEAMLSRNNQVLFSSAGFFHLR
jgi:hypothetical protein